MQPGEALRTAQATIDALRAEIPEADQAEFDAGLAKSYGAAAEAAGPLAVGNQVTSSATLGAAVGVETAGEVTDSPADSSEQGEQDHTDLLEALLSTFDQAYTTYGFMVDTANTGRNKKNKLAPVDEVMVLTKVEALLSNESLLAELQLDIDYFTANPEANSPDPGYDIIIVPEGMTKADDQAVASSLQAKTESGYENPYIRSDRYDDSRPPVVSGKGFQVKFAPRHYNIPSDTAEVQTTWTKGQNVNTHATERQTATDSEALAQINNLLDQDSSLQGSQYDESRFHKTYFRRFDQVPVGGDVSRVFVNGDGRLRLGRSDVHVDDPARALVVPKA